MTTRLMRLATVAATGLVALALTGCGNSDADGGTGTSDADDVLDGTVTVFAAASLTDAFDEIGAAFEDAEPGVTVEVSYAGSSSLRQQILHGAPADVFASADTSTMDEVVDAGAADDPDTFATNRLQIAVPAGNEAGVDGLADLADDDLLIGLCAEEVPCGEFGREALANAGVAPAVDTNEPDVRALLTKLEAGELDAGIVYVTDVASAGDEVEGIDIPDDLNVTATYPIATLADAPNPEAAEAFVDFVLSDAGKNILAAHGFGRP